MITVNDLRKHLRIICAVMVASLSVACSGSTSQISLFGSNGSVTFSMTYGQPSSEAAVGNVVLFADTSAVTATAWLWEFGDGVTSDQPTTGHIYLTAGSYTVRLTRSTASGLSSGSRVIQVAARSASLSNFSMVETISDRAQLTTLGFDGLALMTGNLAAQSFFPPGKLADYTGFQYLRDNDADHMGHNTSFLTRVACNVLFILNDAQLAKLKDLAINQQSQVQEYGYRRFTLMQAFRDLLDGIGSNAALNLTKVKAVSRDLYVLDGQVAFDRAYLYAEIYSMLDTAQRAYLDSMKGKGWASWPDIKEEQVADKLASLPQGTRTLMMTYAGDIYSWYVGSVDADVYFCPERHGTYFGSFYMKDAPAMGHEGYNIDEQLTAVAGSALTDANKGYVTPNQADFVSNLVALQRDNLYSGERNIVQLRTEISLSLRQLQSSLLNSQQIKDRVLLLSALYGELDGENNYHYATGFARLYANLSSQQKQLLSELRQSILSGTYADGAPFDFTTATTYYLYSEPIVDLSVLAVYMSTAMDLFL